MNNDNRKEQLTVKIIQINHAVDKNKKELSDLMLLCNKSLKDFDDQRQLRARIQMIQRVLNATLKMLDSNKLELWMIDENIINKEKQIKKSRRKTNGEKK